MKNTTKLTFSVYALTLVLSATGAYAGSYAPTCDGNDFTLSYKCSSASGSSSYGDNNIVRSFSDQDIFLAANTTQVQSTLNCNRTGYIFDGWASKETTSGASAADITKLSFGTPYPATTLWQDTGTTPAVEGTPMLTLYPYWTMRTGTITFEGLTEKTAVNGTSLDPASKLPSTKVPAKPGYSFRGYFADQGVALEATNFYQGTPDQVVYDMSAYLSNKSTDSFVNGRCGSVGGAWNPTKNTSESLEETRLRCPWYLYNGNITDSTYVGYAAADFIARPENENNVTLYSAWEGYDYTVSYKEGGVPYGENCTDGYCVVNPDGSTTSGQLGVLPENSTIEIPDEKDCKFGVDCKPENALLHNTVNDMFDFAGWSVAVKKADGSQVATVTISAADTNKSLHELLANDLATAGDRATVTLTALWSGHTTYVRIIDRTDKEPKLYTYEAGKWSEVTQGADGSIVVTPKATAPVPEARNDYTFRGYVAGCDGSQCEDVQEGPSATFNYKSLATPFLIANKDYAWNTESVNGVPYTASVLAQLATTSSDNTVDIYATWARNCATLGANVAGCTLYISPTTGMVDYANSCNSGYHMTVNGKDTQDVPAVSGSKN